MVLMLAVHHLVNEDNQWSGQATFSGCVIIGGINAYVEKLKRKLPPTGHELLAQSAVGLCRIPTLH